MDEPEKLMLEMQGDIKVMREKISNHDDEIAELNAQTKLNVKDIQNLNINIVELSKDMKNYSNVMKDLTEQLKKITQQPAEFNEKVRIGVITGTAVFIITTLGTLLINYLSKR